MKPIHLNCIFEFFKNTSSIESCLNYEVKLTFKNKPVCYLSCAIHEGIIQQAK